MTLFLHMFLAFTLGWTLRAFLHAKIDGHDKRAAVNLFGVVGSIAALFLVGTL